MGQEEKEFNQEITQEERDNYKRNYEKHLLAGTLTNKKKFHRFSGKEIAKLDLKGPIDVDDKNADDSGNVVIVITDQNGKSLQRSTCCP